MAIFRALRGKSSRIDLGILPFHDGWGYLTSDDGGLYFDVLEEDGTENRVRVTSKASRALYGTLKVADWEYGRQTLSFPEVKAASDGFMAVDQDVTDAEMEAAKNAELHLSSQEDGRVTVAVFGETPVCDIPVVIILLN